MSKFFGKPLDIKIELIDPPPLLKYSPKNPTVKGIVKIDFNEEVKKISHICCGLQGKAQMTYYASDLSFVGLQTTVVNRRLIQQNVDFFNLNTLIPLDCEGCNMKHTPQIENGLTVFTFNAGDHIEYKFNFKFLLDFHLPSSTKSYGSMDGDVKVSYEVYADIHKLSKFLSKPRSYMHTVQPVIFQSGLDPRIPKTIQTLSYKKTVMFKNKLKRFYFDKDKNALIPSSMSKSHSKTKFIRKLWDNNYKNENYSLNTKTIPLTVNFQVESSFDLDQPFSSQISLKFLSDLSSMDITSNQTTDFVLNGQSTGLGLINIESLRVETRNFITLQHQQFMMRENTVDPIVKFHFKDLILDIKDFDYNKQNNVFEKEVDIELLAEAADQEINKSLMELLGENTIMCAGHMEGWLQSQVELNFIWKITDGTGSHSKRVSFQTTSTPDFLLGMSTVAQSGFGLLSEDALPPPTYEMSKSDIAVGSQL